MDRLPYVTRGLPGTGGGIKSELADFVVEEIPLYEPLGSGEHVYLRVRREGRTTREVVLALARLSGVPERDVGYAGQKDRRARVTQTFSLAHRGDERELAARATGELGLEVLDCRRHANKLRRGHLLGNRFEVVVAGAAPEAAQRAQAIADALGATGLPNFYGPQRFGTEDRNAARGARRIAGEDLGRARSWIARLELSAWQSELFNRWLCERIGRGEFERLQAGDVAKKTDTGGLFDVEDVAREAPRLARREITYTGPIYGASMRWASDAAGAIERELLARSGVDVEALGRARLEGSRRAARIFVADLAIGASARGLELSFRLPKGAYATVFLREVTKSDAEVDDGCADEG